MGNKNLAYLGLGIVFLLFVGTFAMGGGMGKMSGKSVSKTDDMAGHHDGNSQSAMISNAQNDMSDHHSEKKVPPPSNINLSKYRSEEIPEDCRLADYDDDVKKWAEHLSHHGNTKYCLEYYEDIITPKTSESSLDMPEKCVQPAGRDKESWKEHLGHHQETKECLKYFD